MTNSQYINAYKKTLQSSSSVTSSHEIVRTLMKELVNSPIKMVGKKEKEFAKKVMNTPFNMRDVAELCEFLISPSSRGISGKLISVKWDNWKKWIENIEALSKSDLYTLRRITARDRDLEWGDL